MYGPSFTGYTAGSPPWNIRVLSFSDHTFIGSAPPSWLTLPAANPGGGAAAEVNVGGLTLSTSDGRFTPTRFSLNGVECDVVGGQRPLSSPSPHSSPSPSPHSSPSPSPHSSPSPSPHSSPSPSPSPDSHCKVCLKLCLKKESSALRQLHWNLPPGNGCNDLVKCVNYGLWAGKHARNGIKNFIF